MEQVIVRPSSSRSRLSNQVGDGAAAYSFWPSLSDEIDMQASPVLVVSRKIWNQIHAVENWIQPLL